jgi:hypothetical protein
MLPRFVITGMNRRMLLMTCALALSTLGIVSAKSYSFTLTAPTKVGTVTLKPAEYDVIVKGDQAIFTAGSGKTYKVPVKVAQGDKKFDNTTAVTSTKDGADTLSEIDLGGSNTKLQFGQ